VSTETKNRGKAGWIFPLLLALPFLAAIALVLSRYGTDLLNLINVMIKAVVVA
jgi:hypothetical protein